MRNITAHFKSDSDVVKLHHLQLTENAIQLQITTAIKLHNCVSALTWQPNNAD